MIVPGVKLFQLGYVTGNMDTASRRFADRFGMSEFHFMRGERGNRSGERRICLAYLNGMMIEIVEPGDNPDALYADALTLAGEGIALHHHGYLAPDHHVWRRVEECLARRQTPVIRRGSRAKVLDYIYANTFNELGHHIEYILLGPESDKLFGDVPHYWPASGGMPARAAGKEQ